MPGLSLALGLCLPWALGALWFARYAERIGQPAPGAWARRLGYGFFLGYLALYALLRLNASFGAFNYSFILSAMAMLNIQAAVSLWRARRQRGPSAGSAPANVANVSPNEKILCAVAGTLILVHLGAALLEVLMRPVFAWDAWSTWTYRAKVWFYTGELNSFVSPAAWPTIGERDIYAIHAYGYPIFNSLMQAWIGFSLGYWSETLVNLPAFLCGTAIGLALYGQCRSIELKLPASLMSVYVFLSLPIIGAHMSLGGYADLWLAGYTGMGCVALLHGLARRARESTVLGVLLLAASPLVKNEGLVWFMMIVPSMLLAQLGKRMIAATLSTLALVATACIATDKTYLDLGSFGSLGFHDGSLHLGYLGQFELEFYDSSLSFFKAFFILGSWNVFALMMLGTVILCSLPVFSREKKIVALFASLVFGSLFFIFFLTDQGRWATQLTAINRLPLQFSPATIFAACLVWRSHLDSRPFRARTAELAPAAGLAWPIVVATVVSLATLAVYLAPHSGTNMPVEVAAKTWTVDTLRFVLGSGSRIKGEYVVRDYHKGKAILSSGPVALESSNSPILRYSLHGPPGNKEATFFWRTKSDPEQFHILDLSPAERGYVDLSSQKGWRGQLIEFGFLFNGAPGNEFHIRDVSLNAPTLANTLRLVLAQWTQFEPWSQRSINYANGGAKDQAVSLTLVVAAWVIVAIATYLIIRRGENRMLRYEMCAVLFVVGWLLLDARWIANRVQQAYETTNSYAGRSQKSKLLRGADAQLYSFIEFLKIEVLPREPAFIVIVKNGSANEYFRLRAQYHLAPHNVYNSEQLPSRDTLKKAEFLLQIGKVDGLSYDPTRQELRSGDTRLEAIFLRSSSDAVLYKLRRSEVGAVEG